MAKIVGIDVKLKKEDFNRVFSKNSGQKITTEGITEGWKKLKKELSNDLIDNLKDSPYYIRGVNG